MTFSWSPATDAETPQAGLTYNLRVGTTPGGNEVMSGMAIASPDTRLIPAMGNTQHNTSWTLRGLADDTYYWSVQAVDSAFCGGPWASQESVTVSGGLPAGVWLVAADASPGGDGLSWATAFQNPQAAVDVASSGEEVWVKAGTYINAVNGGGTNTVLVMVVGVQVYGGFAGGETTRSQRNWTANVTTLDGQNTAYHVVEGASDGALDGFTITGGNAVGTWPASAGGGPSDVGDIPSTNLHEVAELLTTASAIAELVLRVCFAPGLVAVQPVLAVRTRACDLQDCELLPASLGHGQSS